MKLNDYIRKIVLSADSNSYDWIEDKKKSILLNLFFYFFFSIVIGFLIYSLVVTDKTYFIVNISGLLVGVLLYYLYRVKKMLRSVSGFFVMTVVIFATFLIQTGGIKNTALVFSLLIPLPTILLVGKRKGMITLFVFLLINAVGFAMFNDALWFPRINMKMVERTSIVFVLISVMAYFNEFVFEVLYLKLEKLSETLRYSQQRYKNLAVNKEQFVSLISNNLGDHIGSFAAIANLLNDEYYELGEQRRIDLIRSLANFSQQNFKLLQDLMKWSTVQSDTIPFLPKPIKLEKIYRDVIELFHPLIEEKKISFFLKMKSNSEIFADEDMVGAIMRSLVSNAIKFSHVGGEVKISAIEEGDKMVVTISDKGTGMSRKDLMRVNSSVSFSNPGTLQETGTGIGLILAKEFLQKNQGDFHVESEKGKGTDVSFTLPLVE